MKKLALLTIPLSWLLVIAAVCLFGWKIVAGLFVLGVIFVALEMRWTPDDRIGVIRRQDS